ncbi:MAG: hypothetical protein H2212_12170 [Ruminococcus sp.]|jgi:hypothetical protein|nr:hypothetical protein [Ruminococcus sp.]
MITESYSVSFYGLDPRYYSIPIVGNIWNISSEKVYEETGIRISGYIQESYVVGQDDEELNNTNIITIDSTRIPHEIATPINYWNAYEMVLEEVRYGLGNPRMSLTVVDVDITDFERS